MANANFKNTIINIKDGFMYMKIDLSVVLDEDTIRMRGNNKNDAVAIANTYQEDYNDAYHVNVQVNTNTKANKKVFKAKKQALKDAKKKVKVGKKQTPNTKTTKKATNLVKVNGMTLDLNDEWDARKYAQIQARA